MWARWRLRVAAGGCAAAQQGARQCGRSERVGLLHRGSIGVGVHEHHARTHHTHRRTHTHTHAHADTHTRAQKLLTSEHAHKHTTTFIRIREEGYQSWQLPKFLCPAAAYAVLALVSSGSICSIGVCCSLVLEAGGILCTALQP